MVRSGRAWQQDFLDTLQKATNFVETILSVNIAFEIRKRLIAKGYGEVGKLQQSGTELWNLLACLLKQGAQLIQIVSFGKWYSQGA